MSQLSPDIIQLQQPGMSSEALFQVASTGIPLCLHGFPELRLKRTSQLGSGKLREALHGSSCSGDVLVCSLLMQGERQQTEEAPHLSHKAVPIWKAPPHHYSVIGVCDIEKFSCCALYILMGPI